MTEALAHWLPQSCFFVEGSPNEAPTAHYLLFAGFIPTANTVEPNFS